MAKGGGGLAKDINCLALELLKNGARGVHQAKILKDADIPLSDTHYFLISTKSSVESLGKVMPERGLGNIFNPEAFLAILTNRLLKILYITHARVRIFNSWLFFMVQQTLISTLGHLIIHGPAD